MSVKIAGFTLPEMLIAMALSSLLLTGAARLLPLLQKQQLIMFTRMQLQEELEHLASMLTKHLRRAGYCNGHCHGQAFRFTARCLAVRWDNNSNGRWEQHDNRIAERFAFRLHEGALESQRGGDNCQSGSWEKITDPRNLKLIDFTIEHLPGHRFYLRLAASSKRLPDIRVYAERWVSGNNL
ncbi:prepilin peptidase-dependent protein [Enterobacteriaceae bacterium LUAb1]